MNGLMRWVLAAAISAGGVFLASCGMSAFGNQKGLKQLQGVWYEQAEDGDTLTIEGDKMHVQGSTWSADGSFRVGDPKKEQDAYAVEKNQGWLMLVPDEYFFFYEMYLSPDGDELACYTMPHTDGDGGHHRLSYRKTPWVKPPEPVYGERTDRSDPSAPKDILKAAAEGLTVLDMEFYDEGAYMPPGWDMAQLYPAPGVYAYQVTALPEGTARLKTNLFEEELVLPAELFSELKQAVADNDLGSLNGLDIRTADVPEDVADYRMALTFLDGEGNEKRLTSTANYKDVPENWTAFQKTAMDLLFSFCEKAGYYPATEEFHPTAALKRYGAGTKKDWSFDTEEKRIENSKFKVWYDLLVPSENAPAALKTAAEAFNRDLEQKALAAEAAWGKDYRFVYYDTQMLGTDPMFLCFRVSEGHVKADYSSTTDVTWYCLDAETGKQIKPADLVTDLTALRAVLTETMALRFNFAGLPETIRGAAFQEKLREDLEHPENLPGFGLRPYSSGLVIELPHDYLEGKAWVDSMTLWAEELQDIMSDRYVTVRELEDD